MKKLKHTYNNNIYILIKKIILLIDLIWAIKRKQSFVRGDEKRKPTHRRTPSGSATPRKESVPQKEKAPLPKDKKAVVSKPIAQSEKLRRKNETNFEKENREKLVQKIAKSVKNEEVKVIGTRIRADSVGDKDKFVLHVEDATVFSTSSPKPL